MLTLDEAIAQYKEKAKELRTEASWYTHPECKRVKAKIDDCLECASALEQLAGWLKELKAYRECQYIQDECADCDYCSNSKNTWQEENDK